VLAFAASAAPKALQDGEGTVTNAGVRVWYRVEGAAKAEVPILMIHGGPGATARPFEKTIGPELAKSRPVIYMDYRGAGRSDRPKDPKSYSFAILASDAEALRVHLGIKKWIVFGHSNGGATALTYAAAHPAEVAGLVLCNPLLNAKDLEMNMVHKVVRSPPDKYEQARAIYKSKDSMNAKFDGLLDLIDRRTRYGFQFFKPRTTTCSRGFRARSRRSSGRT
jgi:proline iminopeptidase